MGLSGEIIRFLVAGLVTTATDFIGYNLFLKYVKTSALIAASVLSVSLAIIVSFLLNRIWVFGHVNPVGWPIVSFLVVTMTSAYGIQSVVIYLLAGAKLPFARFSKIAIEFFPWGRNGGVTAEAVERNIIKLGAVIAGVVWNFLWYRLYVFA